MVHHIKEEHLDDICARCHKPHGNDITLERHNNKDYEIITCENCGYEIIKPFKEKSFTDKWEMFHKT